MKRAAVLFLASVATGGCVIADVTATRDAPGAVAREYASPTAFYAKSIVIQPGYETIRLPGIIADPLTPGGADYGDTETQTASVLGKIAAGLNSVGASEADVVAMTVYLVAPQPGAVMDFQGMMRAYGKRYGSGCALPCRGQRDRPPARRCRRPFPRGYPCRAPVPPRPRRRSSRRWPWSPNSGCPRRRTAPAG